MTSLKTKAPRRRLRWRPVAILLAAATLAGVLLLAAAASVWGGSLVRDKLQQLATGAGMTLQVADVSVSPLGVVSIKDLHLERPSGGDVVSFAHAEGTISPWRAITGDRRPERVEVDDLKLDIRVTDGRPAELLDLLRSARKMVRREASDGTKQTSERASPVLIVRGGEAQLRLTGQGAELLPKGLTAHGLQVHLDPDHGIGKVEALVEGSVQSKLKAKVVPAVGERPARVEARFQPEFRIGLPLPGLAGDLVDALVVAGFGYDRQSGPSIDGLALRQGKTAVLEIERLLPADGGVGLRAANLAFRLPNAWLKKSAPKGSLEGVLAKQDLAGTVGTIAVDLVHPLTGALSVRMGELNLPLPLSRGNLSLASATMVTRGLPEGDPLKAIASIEVSEPKLLLTWREKSLAALPGGQMLYDRIEGARWGKRDAPTADEEAVSATGKKAKGKKAKRKRRRRRSRKPAIQAAIRPIRKLLKRTLAGLEELHKAATMLARWPGLKLKVSGGSFDLMEPAAEEPLGGLRKVTVDLTARLGDGTRGFLLSAEPFSSSGGWGEAKLEFTGGGGDRLERATWSLGGSQWALALASGVSHIVAGEGAELRCSGRLELPEKGTGPVLHTDLSIRKMGVEWWRFAPRPIDDLNLDLKLRLSADEETGGMELQATEIKLGEALLTASLNISEIRSDKVAAQLKLAMPRQDCGKVASSLPASLMPSIGSITAEGEAGWTFELNVPLRKPYKGKLDATLDDKDCLVTAFGDIDMSELAGSFSRPVNESGTILEDQLIGPKSDAWVDIADLPPWVPYAVMATEDAAFYHHRGLRLGLLSRAIKMCMDYGRFVYGGSTITQQLVKNLFLTRDKYLARKFEELLIVWHMERNLMADAKLADAEDPTRATKDRIMELYINGIEFGPHTYGVVRAATLYFAKPAKELTPLESAFLAANKPCPKCGHKRFTTQKWTPWWQERMVGIMKRMRKDGIISDEQFVAEAPYVPRFVGWPQTEAEASEPDVGGVEE